MIMETKQQNEMKGYHIASYFVMKKMFVKSVNNNNNNDCLKKKKIQV